MTVNTPSRVKTLLVPLGPIKYSSFLRYSNRLTSTAEVRLVDVTPDSRPDRALFSPQGYPNGKVVFDFSLAPVDPKSFSLLDIEPWRQQLAVFALASYGDSTYSSLVDGVERLKTEYPSALIHKVLVFGVPHKGVYSEELQNDNVLAILSSKNSGFSLETAMCDITGDFLGRLSQYAHTRQVGSFKSPATKELDAPAKSADKSSYHVSLKKARAARARTPDGTSSNLSVDSKAMISKSGSISMSFSDRTNGKQQARTQKFLGSLYLLSGRLPDALKEFSEAATTLKGLYDHLWYASALESIGICLLLLAFLEVPTAIPPVALNATLNHSIQALSDHASSSSSSLPLSPATTGDSPPRHSSQLSSLKHTLSSSTTMNSIPPSLAEFLPDLTEAVLRFYLRSSHSNEESVPQVIYCDTILRFLKFWVILRQGGGWNGATLSAIVRGTGLPKISATNEPSALAIAEMCNRVVATEVNNLPISAQAHIYCGLASVYASLGMSRKQAFTLRSLFQSLLVHVRQGGNLEHQESVALLEAMRWGQEDATSVMEEIAHTYGGGRVDSIGRGWTVLKISFLKSCISMAKTMGRPQSTVHFIHLLLSTCADMLNPEDQLRLMAEFNQAVEAARKLGIQQVMNQYWDSYILRGMRLVGGNSMSTIVTKTAQRVSSDVFLYNPYTKKETSPDSCILEVGAQLEIVVRLQNPFHFEVQVQHLSLLTDDDDFFEGAVRGIYLPPSAVHDVVVPVTPRKVGKVQVLGCRIQVAGSKLEDYHLKHRVVKRYEEKIKDVGILDSECSTLEAPEETEGKLLEFDVIPAQPTLLFQEMTLSNRGWLMLLDGEKVDFEIVLANYSAVDTSFVDISVSDNSMEWHQSALKNKEISAVDIYDHEYYLYKQPIFVAEKGSDVIKSQQASRYKIQINGARKIHNARIRVDYGMTDEENSNRIWLRRLPIPINVSVYGCINIAAIDIVPLPKLDEGNGLLKDVEKLGETGNGGKWFLAIVDLQNSWSAMVTVTLRSRDLEGSWLYQNKATITPDKQARLLLPFRWDAHTADQLDKPIPSLSNRQFVVDSRIRPEHAKSARAEYWCREQLLQILEGTWKESSSARNGVVDFRQYKFPERVIGKLRPNEIELDVVLEQSGYSQELEVSKDKWKVKVDEIDTVIRVFVTNNCKTALTGILRLIVPIDLDPGTSTEPRGILDDHSSSSASIVYNGSLQHVLTNVEYNQTQTVDFCVTFLSPGTYKWSANLEISPGTDLRKPFSIKVVK